MAKIQSGKIAIFTIMKRLHYINGSHSIMTVRNQILFILWLLLYTSSAKSQKHETVEDTSYKFTNELIQESSPYLLQHAHNPVNWLPWGDKAFEKAEKEDKLVLVSIGYSSCHWCHVMEHESFEDEEVAALMNDHFVCIKVDREERPDVDQIYMSAVQLMTGSGGWPLNCFTLPDGRPIYGGTYFPKNKWVDVLKQLYQTYQNNPEGAIKYAEKLTEGVQQSELITTKSEMTDFNEGKLKEMVANWQVRFDSFQGGPNKAPKFPLPNNYDFLMHYAHTYKDSAVMNHVDLTLEKMAMGGIYDQIGGGFARYSTDTQWKVPHFEKMLYDNAQLVSLYCHAYQRTKNPLYEEVVNQTLAWVKREMTTEVGSFYSALDADSEGEEGKFYVWTKEELKEVVGKDFELIQTYYNIKPQALWEGNYILHRRESDAAIADQFEMDLSELRNKIRAVDSKLLAKRSERIRPGLDDKSLTSWNAMMNIAFLDAYQVFGEDEYLAIAMKNLKWFEENQLLDSGEILHTYKENESKISGFLDDYAYAIKMYVKLYEVSFDEVYLSKAQAIVDYVIENFEDAESGMLFYTSSKNTHLVARKMEISDNVIPSSNSIMARNLWVLGAYLDHQTYRDKSIQMLANVYSDIHTYGSAYSNWGIAVMNMINPFYEVAITGPNWEEKVDALNSWYIPNKILMGGTKGSLALLQGKFGEKTTIYVCVDKTCQLPVDNIPDAIAQMKR